MPFGVNPLTGRPGPAPKQPREGDKAQARQRVNVEVRTGRRPHPNALPCADCGHVWTRGERRHEYDHVRGYGAAAHLDVESVCTRCHAARDSLKAKQTHCSKGHAFDAENTGRKPNGTRFCKTCRRAFEKTRQPRGSAYWRKVNAKRRGTDGR